MADENRTQQVSLGCGTLILIALIVLIFSGRGSSDLEREVQGLRSEVVELRKSIEAQTSEIKELQRKLAQQE
jgi:Sec-independent protein translocase protein TatA